MARTTRKIIARKTAAPSAASNIAPMIPDSNVAVAICELDGCVAAWNADAEVMSGSSAPALELEIRDLVPGTVAARGLMAALAEIAKAATDYPGTMCLFDCPEPVEGANDIIAAHFYRIAQEAVTNAVTHAQAATIIFRREAGDRGLELSVTDDSIGMDTDSASGQGSGIKRQRCKLEGGDLTVRKHAVWGSLVACAVRRKWIN